MKDIKQFLFEARDKWNDLFKKYFGNDYLNPLQVKHKVFDYTDDDEHLEWTGKLEEKDWTIIELANDDMDAYVTVAVLPKSPSDKSYMDKAIKALQDADEDDVWDML